MGTSLLKNENKENQISIVFINNFELQLKDKLNRLSDEKKLYLDQLKNNEVHSDPSDEGTDCEAEAKLEHLIESIERKLKQVEKALNKLKNGHYGICEECDERISEKRLKSLPEAVFCINCVF